MRECGTESIDPRLPGDVWQLTSFDNEDGSRAVVNGILQMRVSGDRAEFVACVGNMDLPERVFCDGTFHWAEATASRDGDILHIAGMPALTTWAADFSVESETARELALALPVSSDDGRGHAWRWLPDGRNVDHSHAVARFTRVATFCLAPSAP